MESLPLSLFDSFFSNLNQTNETSFLISQNIQLIILWYKKYLKLKSLKASFLSIKEQHLQEIYHLITNLEGNSLISFRNLQEILENSSFSSSILQFLNLLPYDPSLKLKNKKFKNSKFFSLSILISFFSSEILQFNNQFDDSFEAKQCLQASKLLLFSFKRFYHSISSNIRQFRFLSFFACLSLFLSHFLIFFLFRVAFVGYRFCVRNYLECLEKWKLLDQERSQKLYEVSYIEVFTIYVTTQHHLDQINRKILINLNENNQLLEEKKQIEDLFNETKTKIQHFRNILRQLLGRQK